MKISGKIFVLLLVLFNCNACQNMELLVLDIDVVERGEDYYLLATVENRSNKDFYISHWNMIRFITIYNNENMDVTKPMFEKEFILQTRFRKPVFNSKKSDYLLDYEELFYEPATLRKQLIAKAIDEEIDVLLKLDGNHIDSNNLRKLKSILFWKYNQCRFIKAGESFVDSTTVTSLYKSSERFKLLFSINPHRDTTKLRVEIDEHGNTVEIDCAVLKKIDSYYLFENSLKDSLIIKGVDLLDF